MASVLRCMCMACADCSWHGTAVADHRDTSSRLCSVVALGDLRGSMSDVDISVSSRPASRSSSLDTCGLDQQQPTQAKAAAQAATMVKLLQERLLLCACLYGLPLSARAHISPLGVESVLFLQQSSLLSEDTSDTQMSGPA